MSSRIRRLGAVAVMSTVVMLAAVPGIGAQSVGQAAHFSLAGTITGLDGAPLPEAEVTIIAAGADSLRMRSDSAGHFRASGLSQPSVTVHVRRLGYRPQSVDVTMPHDPIFIVLEANPAELGTVKVREIAAELDDRLREFYNRKETNSFGRFFEQADIERRNPQYLSEMLRNTPGVTLVPSTRGGYILHLRGCSPLVWIDGVRIPDTQLDEVVMPSDVAGMEVYSSFAGVPAQYFDRSASCGTILIWSRAK